MKIDGHRLTRQIVIGMIAGVILGLIVNLALSDVSWVAETLVAGILGTIGKLFLALLKMLIVPLVLVSLVCGTASLSEPSRLGRLGGKTLLLYMGTTALAISTALLLATLFQPGEGAVFADEEVTFEAAEAPPLSEVLINVIPTNPVAAMAEGNMLAIIAFAMLLGLAISLSGPAGDRVKAIFDDLNVVVMTLVAMVMKTAPLGVFALLTKAVAELGLDSFGLLADYFFLVLGVLLLHGLVTYPVLLTVLGRLHPLTFLSKMRAAMVFAFSTASSNATLPVTLRTVEKRLGVSNSVASFTIPLGATINMDGTAIMQGVATVFIANVYGIDLSFAQLLTVALMATMASIGAAGVPGVGLILLATVLAQVGIPVEGIGLILGIDRLLDMTRTAVNITGDAAVTCIVARSEGDLDLAIYDDPDAGDIEDTDAPSGEAAA